MAGNSFNLVDYIKEFLTGEVTNRMATALGESRDRTEWGLNAAVPSLLGGLDNTASTPDGARRLASAVDDADDGVLSNIGSIFGRDSFNNIGSGTLQSLLGVTGLSALTGNIGKTTGLSGKTASMLMGFLAPIVFGALKQLKFSRGLDASGLSGLLASQRDNFSAATPVPMETRDETYRTVRPVAEAGPRRSSMGWILPLAVLAGVLGLIWFAASRSTVRAGRDVGGLAERTARTRDLVTLDTLKSKYQSVFDVARAQGVDLSSTAGPDGKLALHGTAPSTEAANRVWDEIKRINPGTDDVMANIQVDSSMFQAPSFVPEIEIPREKPSAPDDSRESTSNSYVVKAGDTLGSISTEFYGTSQHYMRIFNENKSLLKNPHQLEVGQRLEIPR